MDEHAASVFMVTEVGSCHAEMTGRRKWFDCIGRLQGVWPISGMASDKVVVTVH